MVRTTEEALTKSNATGLEKELLKEEEGGVVDRQEQAVPSLVAYST